MVIDSFGFGYRKELVLYVLIQAVVWTSTCIRVSTCQRQARNVFANNTFNCMIQRNRGLDDSERVERRLHNENAL